MSIVPIPLVGQSYQHRSLPLSSQVTKNWYPEINQESKSILSMMPTPGSSLFSSGDVGIDRGCTIFSNEYYKVSGGTLYKVSSSGVESVIGPIAGSEQCIFANDGYYLIIVSDGVAYSYDGTTLGQITDVDIGAPVSVSFLNSQMIFSNDDHFVTADAGDPLVIDGLNYAAAESHPDKIIRDYAYREELLFFGEKTIERWYNSGVGSPPFDRVQGGIIPVGLGAKHSVAHNDEAVYFLGDDKNVYQLVGYSKRKIVTIPIAHNFENSAEVSDAKGVCVTWEGQNFYIISFPTKGETWAYSESANGWFQMGHKTNGRHLVNSYAYCYGRHLFCDYRNADVLEWDIDLATDNGDYIQRVRHSGVIDGKLYGPQLAGKELFMSTLEIHLETGIGSTTGQGEDPQVMLQFSDDGGRTWSNELWASAGKIGAYQWQVEFEQLGCFHSRIIRLVMSDPSQWAIYHASANIEVGI